MKSKLLWRVINIALCLFLISTVYSFSHSREIYSPQNFSQKKVSGKVTDKQGKALTGVTVAVEGTNIGTITDYNGNYSIQVTEGQTIIFSSVGYKTKEILYKGQISVNVALEASSTQLNEVVAIGYGSVAKKDVTGSVTTIRSDNFNKGNVINPIGLIQGKVPGLDITSTSGDNPNGDYQILLRGLNTLSGGRSPLIIVDGIVGNNTLQMLDPNEIASISVLKDGSAAAIYGTRATNGVILITTKKPQEGKVTYQISTNLSIQFPSGKERFMSPGEYRETLKKYYPGLEQSLDKGYSTDWQKQVTRTPLTQNYSFSATGGTKNINFLADLYYKDNEGIIDQTYAKTMTPSIYVNSTGLNGRLNIKARLIYSFIKRKGGNNNIIFQALDRNPTEPVYDSSDAAHGGYYTVVTATGQPNPVASIKEHENNVEAQFFTGDALASYTLINGLKLNVHYSFNINQDYSGTYETRYFPDLGTNGEATLSTGLTHNILFEPWIEYNKTFSNQNIQAIGGYSYYGNSTEGLNDNNFDFDVDNFSYNNIGAGYALTQGLATIGSSKSTNKLISFYGRVLYNYNQKYLLTISARYEGSSRFGSNNKWGMFPAVSAGWRVTEENFAKNLSWLSNLKVRAGYGVTGNQDIPDYQSLPTIGISSREFFYNGQWVNAYQPTSNPNPDLKWEKKGEYDLGIDFGFLNNYITGSFDYYYRRVSDLLWNYAVPVPPNVYPTTYANVGVLTNHGVELTISANPFQTHNFSWSTTLTYAANKNKLVSFSNAARGYKLNYLEAKPVEGTWAILIKPGQPIGNFDAPIFLGSDSSGNAVYKDVNGDGKVDVESQDDRQIVGNEFPKFELGWTNQIRFKNFDLSFFFRGVFGQSILNYERLYYENWLPFLDGQNVLKSLLKNPGYKGIQTYDSRYIENASYVKLSSMELGYDINLAKGPNLRVFVSCQNLFTITNYQGSDPEQPIPTINTTIGPSGTGNLNYYPYTRTLLFGMNLNF